MQANISASPSDELLIKIGDMDILRQMLIDHGGWEDTMKKCLLEPCEVNQPDASVKTPPGRVYRLNPEMLKKYKKPIESVLLTSDESVLQAGLKGYFTADELKCLVGQRVELVQKGQDGKCTVKHQSKEYTVNENCLLSTVGASKSSSSTTTDEESLTRYSVGDMVKVIDDKNKVKALQEGHGGWNKLMKHILNEKGMVKCVGPDGDLIVEINGKEIILNPKCVVKVDDEIVSHYGDSPLHAKVRNKNYPLGGQLIAQAGYVNVLKEKQRTPIMMVAQTCLEEFPTRPVHHPDARLDIGDEQNNTALRLAAKNSNDGAWLDLYQMGANTDAINDKQPAPSHPISIRSLKTTLESSFGLPNDNEFVNLYQAVMLNNTTYLRFLINRNADLNIRNNKMQTALHIAVSHKNMDCVKILVDSKAKLDLQDKCGDTPLHYAICLHNVEKRMNNMYELDDICDDLCMLMDEPLEGNDKPEDIAIYLVEHGARLKTINSYGRSPLSACNDKTLLKKLRHLEIESSRGLETSRDVSKSIPLDKRTELVQATVQSLQIEIKCGICTKRTNKVAFNCGHQACSGCDSNLYNCHVCRQRIETRTPISS